MSPHSGPLRVRLVILAALLVLTASIYDSVLVEMAAQWWDNPDYSHGMLVPLVSLFYIWEKRTQFMRSVMSPDYRGLLLLLAGLGLLSLGNAGSEYFLMRLSLIMTIAGLVAVIFGTEALLTLRFPIGFLVFMIPLPAIIFNAVAFPLQLFAAQTAAFCLKVAQIPVLREGNLIYLASSSMDVTEACSGIRSLMSLMALGTLFAYITQKRTWKRVLMVFSTLPIAILANASRVTGTGLLAQFVGEEAAQGFYHTFTGWLVFIFAFTMLLFMGFIFSRFPDRKTEVEAAVSVEKTDHQTLTINNRPLWIPIALSSILLVSGFFVNKSLLHHESPVPLIQEFSKFPLQIAQWQGENLPFKKKTLQVLGVSDYLNRRYLSKNGGLGIQRSVWLYVGYYDSQRKGATYHSPKNCLPGSGWEITDIEDLGLPLFTSLGVRQTHVVNKVVIQKGLERQLVFYWYQDRGRIIKSEYWAKIYLVWDSITKRRTDGALVRVSIPIENDESIENALGLGIEYIKTISPILVEYLPGQKIRHKNIRTV